MANGPNVIARVGAGIRPICDRFWLFTIAGLALGVIGVVVFAVAISDRHFSVEELALFGNITLGLLMIVQKVIEAQSTRRLTDALHNSTPNDGRPTGQPNDPVHVEENQ